MVQINAPKVLPLLQIMAIDSPPLVSILIVNWNGAAVLPRCLAAVFAQTLTDYEVLLIDNGSTDGSLDGLEQHWPGLRVERLSENLGFAAANNRGAHMARGRWLALLNNDAYPEPNWLAELLAAAAAYPQAGSYASRLVMANDPQRLDGAGDVYHVSGAVWRRHYGRPTARYGQQSGEVFSPCGAAALYDRAQFLALGGFDETLYSYLEDVDLGFRWRIAGGRCWYVPSAVVAHVGSASHGAHSDFNIYYGQRNMTRVFMKNMPGIWLWLLLPGHLLVLTIFTLTSLWRGRGKAVLRARWDALLALPSVWQQRQQVQAMRKVPAREILRQFTWDWVRLFRRAQR